MSKYIKLEDAIEQIRTVFYKDEYQEWLAIAVDNLINRTADLPTIEVSEDCISKAYLEQEIENHLLSTENLRTEKDEWWNKAFEVMVEIIEDAPSVVPSVVTKQSELTEAYIRGYKDGAKAVKKGQSDD